MQCALPVLRENSQGQTRLLMIQDAQDCPHHAVTSTDQAATMQKMVSQFWGWMPQTAVPSCKKGLNTSLYSQGFGQSTSEASPRPRFIYASGQSVAASVEFIAWQNELWDSFSSNLVSAKNQAMGDHDWSLVFDLQAVEGKTKGMETWWMIPQSGNVHADRVLPLK